MKQLSVLFFLLLSIPLFSQNVRVVGLCTGKNGKALENVLIVTKTNPVQSTLSDSIGRYAFDLTFGDTVDFVYSINGLRESKTIVINKAVSIELPIVSFPILLQNEVTISQSKIDPFTLEKMPTVDAQKITGSVERTLALTTAATSNNELTTNYNVRGGNYDENLVYVNGFLVFRPFLTRSGQQEGMSFIHSALVEDVRFSAGGFDSQYGACGARSESPI